MQRLGFSPFSLQRKIKAEHSIPMERAENSSVSEKERREERKKYLKELKSRLQGPTSHNIELILS